MNKSRFPPNGCQVSFRARCHGRTIICGQSCCIPMPMVPVSQGQRERDWQETDRWIEQRRGGSLWRLFRENTKTFLNVILHHIRIDSRFSRSNVFITFGMIPNSVDQMLAGMWCSLEAHIQQQFVLVYLLSLQIFFEGVQAKVASGVKEEEVGYQLSYSKQELRKVIKEYPGKEVSTNSLINLSKNSKDRKLVRNLHRMCPWGCHSFTR